MEKLPEDPRVKRTRALILAAFEELVATRPLDSITVAEIAERATINRATFYAHFVDKAALLTHSVRTRFRHTLEPRLPCPHAFRAEQLPTLLECVAAFLASFRQGCRQAYRESEPLVHATVQEELARYFESWLSRALPAEQRHLARLRAGVLSWAALGAGVNWNREEQGLSAEHYSASVSALLIHGIAAPDGSDPSVGKLSVASLLS